MKINLVITYSDGREDVYPLPEGQSILGSLPECPFGIQAPGVEPRHLVFSVEANAIFVVNLCDSTTVSFNGAPLDGRRHFEFGDELEVGSVKIRLRRFSETDEDLASSADGVTEVASSVRQDARLGWRSYRKILEKVSPFISPDEAKVAERLHAGGRLMMGRCVITIVLLSLLSLFSQSRHWYVADEIISLVALFITLLSILSLTARYRIRFAGRVLFLVDFWSWGAEPPSETWTTFFATQGREIVYLAALCFMFGWLYDIGAGCIFAQKRRGFIGRFLLLLFTTAVLCSLFFVIPSPISSSMRLALSIPSLFIAIAYPLWAKLAVRHEVEGEVDVAFVAELASGRMGRRCIARAFAVLAIGMPLLLVLGSLGIAERLVWKDPSDLIVTEEDSGERFAWFWWDRGRYLRKSDFDASLIFQVPHDILASSEDFQTASVDMADGDHATDDAASMTTEEDDEIIVEKAVEIALDIFGRIRGEIEEQTNADATNTISLTPFGLMVAEQIARVRVNATNEVAYAQLLETLSPYWITSVNAKSFATHLEAADALAFHLEEVANRETFESGPEPKLYHAQVGVGVYKLSIPSAIVVSGSIEAVVVPCFVLIVIGGFILWKRSADSAVGFWCGVGLVTNALAAFTCYDIMEGVNLIINPLQYPLWELAVHSTPGGIITGIFTLLKASCFFLKYIAIFAQSALFVILCWPCPASTRSGRWKRFGAFMGKAILAASIGVGVALLTGSFFTEVSFITTRIAAILAVGIFGAWLRRKRRFDTEAPELGWMFFSGWVLLEIAILIPLEAIQVVPVSWWNPLPRLGIGISLVGLVAGLAALLGGALFLRLCLKRNFLALMTPGGFTFALFSFSVPILAAVCNSLVGKAFSDSFLQSAQGERIASLSVVVLVLRPLWNTLGKLSRRLSVRNLVRIESGINATLETVLDRSETIDVRDEVYARLGDLGLDGYAFYARSSSDSFDLILNNGWHGQSADSFQMSAYLRHSLGANPHIVDLTRLEQDESLFFQSFELFRIGQRIHATCILPICLGRSVRAILATPGASRTGVLPDNDVLVETINTLGLATVSSLKNHLPDDGHLPALAAQPNLQTSGEQS